MAKKTRTELSTLAINTNLPDNTTELITPTTERAQLTDERESVVNYKDDLGGVSNAGKFITVATDGESLTMVDEPTGELSGTGSAARIAFWSAAKVLTYDDYLSWNTSTDTLNAFIVNATSKLIAAIINSPEGNSITLSTQPTGGTLTPRLTILSGGNVGIGSTAPLNPDSFDSTRRFLTIQSPTGANDRLASLEILGTGGPSATYYVGRIGIGTSTDANYYSAIQTTTESVSGKTAGKAGNLVFGTSEDVTVGGPIARLTISSVGLATFSNGIKFGTGATLDKYEEGTYTATATPSTGTITLKSTANTLAYTRIGRVVTVTGYCIVDNVISPTGIINISLPFNPASGDSFLGAASVEFNVVVSSALNEFWCQIHPVGIQIYRSTGTAVSATSAQQMQTNTDFRLSATYFI